MGVLREEGEIVIWLIGDPAGEIEETGITTVKSRGRDIVELDEASEEDEWVEPSELTRIGEFPRGDGSAMLSKLRDDVRAS